MRPPQAASKPAPALTSMHSAFLCLRRRKQAALFARHAPVLEIDVAGDFDRIGALTLDADDRVIVDTAAPVVYTRLTLHAARGLDSSAARLHILV